MLSTGQSVAPLSCVSVSNSLPSISLLHLAVSLHGERQLIYHAANLEGCTGMWQPHQVAFSCQPYLLDPISGRVLLLQEHVLPQKSGTHIKPPNATTDATWSTGDVYLSSPSMFLHRVRYPSCTWYPFPPPAVHCYDAFIELLPSPNSTCVLAGSSTFLQSRCDYF